MTYPNSSSISFLISEMDEHIPQHFLLLYFHHAILNQRVHQTVDLHRYLSFNF